MMPIMDGYGFIEHRGRDPALASIPIAIVTAGYGVDRDRLGTDVPIVHKPFDVRQLLGLLDTLSAGGKPLLRAAAPSAAPAPPASSKPSAFSPLPSAF